MSNCSTEKTDALSEVSRTNVGSIVGRSSHCSREDTIPALLQGRMEVLCVIGVAAVAVVVRNREEIMCVLENELMMLTRAGDQELYDGLRSRKDDYRDGVCGFVRRRLRASRCGFAAIVCCPLT
jgi:hypothetical protein